MNNKYYSFGYNYYYQLCLDNNYIQNKLNEIKLLNNENVINIYTSYFNAFILTGKIFII